MRLATRIKLPPIIVNSDIDFRTIIFRIVAVTGSRYDRIMILPLLSFLIPILYNKKASAVGKSPKMRAKIKSKKENFIKSDIDMGKNIKIINNVGHHAKKVSKSPFALKRISEFLRLI